jgi:hypothetical protein
MPLSTDANERLYDVLADAIDRAGPEHDALFDEEAVNAALAAALREIGPPA